MLVCAALLIGAGGCAERAPQLPDPADPVVVAEAEAVGTAVAASLVRRDRASGGAVGDWRCRATIWGHDGPARLAVVTCHATYDGIRSGLSGPVRVDAAQVTFPVDGAGYADSLRDLWGEDLAEAYLSSQGR